LPFAGGSLEATKVVFSGGTSVQELSVGGPATPVVEYVRGSDYGGGVGGILYTLRGGAPSFNHYNSRGDVVAQTRKEKGKQKAESKRGQSTFPCFSPKAATIRGKSIAPSRAPTCSVAVR